MTGSAAQPLLRDAAVLSHAGSGMRQSETWMLEFGKTEPAERRWEAERDDMDSEV